MLGLGYILYGLLLPIWFGWVGWKLQWLEDEAERVRKTD
jgi:hypothetical protein